MTTIPPAVLDQYALDLRDTTRQINKELGQDDFLELMMAQLKNQDPMKPMDNGEFLGQMAQFSTVTSIEDMAESMEQLTQTYATGQTLQATQLVGQQVLIESNTFELNRGSNAGGVFELPQASGDVKVEISNPAGVVVRQIDLGAYRSGRHDFSWDGNDDSGMRLPPGNYIANVSFDAGENYQAATVMTLRDVDSVEFGSGSQTTLNTKQGEAISLSDVRQIRDNTSES